jgi:hypothetical protein
VTISQTIVHSLLEVKGCTAEIFVNDVPVSRLGPQSLPSEGMAIQQYLVPGKNRVEVLIEPGSRPSTTRSETRLDKLPDAVVRARVAKFPVDGPVDDESGELLVALEWKGKDHGDDPVLFPRSMVGEFDFGAAFGRWGWQDAPILSPGPELWDEVRAALAEIAQIFRTRSGTLYFMLTEDQCRDAMRSYPDWSEPAVREELERQAKLYEASPEPVLPIEPEKNDFRIVGDGKMVQGLDVDWTTSLKLVLPDGTVVPHPVLLSRLRGKLRVVR